MYAKSLESPLLSNEPVEPVYGPVEAVQVLREAAARVSVVEGESVTPIVNMGGTLTSMRVEASDHVEAGTVVAKIDGREVVAYTSDEPLYRDISRGLQGDDVVTAQEFLVALGYYAASPDGVFGASTAAAVSAFNREHGWGNNNDVLALGSLVWIGAEGLTVRETLGVVGTTVAPGSELFSSIAEPATVAVADVPELPPTGPAALTVNGVTVPYELGSRTVQDVESVSAVVSAMAGALESVGTVTLSEPAVQGSVPSSAVVNDPAGRTCVFTEQRGGVLIVSPTADTMGSVAVGEELVGRSVLINPREVRGDLDCE
ncbi:peptidoglycan-binding domain-containing protein [Demequina sp.]|uniref:peptidoglycan-binding domain-containing protein n=1 Tax=Demequina sp. TaxID=2050685 RepID=UPI003A8843F8